MINEKQNIKKPPPPPPVRHSKTEAQIKMDNYLFICLYLSAFCLVAAFAYKLLIP